MKNNVGRGLARQDVGLKANLHKNNDSGLTMAHIKGLLSAECIIDKNSAKVLNAVLGRSVEYWLNIETHYQQTKTRLAQEHQGASV